MSKRNQAKNDTSYEVGYGKPPKAGQFADGKSGNPKGRPRGSKNLATIVLKESRQMVTVNGPHGARKVMKLEAAVMQVGNKSAHGDLRAARDFFALVQRSEETVESSTGALKVGELDQQLIEDIRRRMAGLSPKSEKSEQEESK